MTDIIYAEIEKKQAERKEIEKQITLETIQHPTVQSVKIFMEQFRNGDINDMKYRKALIDAFVNKIFLYDDKMTILYNSQDSHSDVTLNDESSSGVALAY